MLNVYGGMTEYRQARLTQCNRKLEMLDTKFSVVTVDPSHG